ncbi:MAG: hypothetical protein PHH98_03870 [Candidatus Gracilibacteria bacterium]|nr:hypothetical protein [Candidatus Gracilibacteria bacterium]
MSNMPINIDNLNLIELKNLLKEVRLYSDLKKHLGTRGQNIYNKLRTGEKTLLVEYFPAISEDLAWDESVVIFSKIFNLNVDRKDVIFSKNENIKGGIKVYVDDKMIDLSYNRIERMVRK